MNSKRRYKMRKVCFLMISIFIISTFAFAQTKTITGYLRNEYGQRIYADYHIELVDITCTPYATSKFSEEDGSYKIVVPENLKGEYYLILAVQNHVTQKLTLQLPLIRDEEVDVYLIPVPLEQRTKLPQTINLWKIPDNLKRKTEKKL